MLLGVVSDLHLNERVRFNAHVDVLGAAWNVINERAVDLVVVTGDLAGWDAPHRLTDAERDELAQWLRALSRRCPVVIIRGNHDSISGLGVFEQCAREHPIVVLNSPDMVSNTNRISVEYPFPDVRVGCLPWLPKRDLLTSKEVLLPIADQQRISEGRLADRYRDIAVQADVMLAHLPVRGGMMSPTVVSSGQDVHLDPAVFTVHPNVRYHALGHFHLPQAFPGNAQYAGSIVPTNHGEQGERGLWLVDLDHPEAREFVPLPSWRFATVTAEWANGQWGRIDGLDAIAEGTYTRVTVTGTLAAGVRPDLEPVTAQIVARGAILDGTKWAGDLPPALRDGAIPATTPLQERIRDAAAASGAEPEQVERVVALYGEIAADGGAAAESVVS